jgi:ATP-dependent helicase/nuclease subunit A
VLQLADRLTGYTAVLANLPGASRRLADWRGFREFVRQLDGGDRSLWAVVRQLRRLVEVGAQVERLPLDASNAVSLMTIHASKGLEWAVVMLADATYRSSHSAGSVVFDPEYGVAVKFGDDFEVSGKPLLYVWLERLQQQREAAETLRLLYVALTRSRDRLFLTTCESEGGLLDFLEPGLEAAGVPLETWAFPEAADLQFGDPEPPPLLPLGEVLVEPVEWVATDLPFNAIADYGECPQRFAFHYLQGYPGRATAEGDRLLQRALAQGWRTVSQLRAEEPDLTPAEYENVVAALQDFDESSVFEPLRDGRFEERSVVWNSQGLHFHETVLLWGETGVAMVRSPLDCDPDAVRLALEAIARATRRSQLFLLDLQQNQLYTWASKPRERRLSKWLRQLRSGDTTATPSPERCDRCPYQDICGDRYVC